ncbi:C-type natriuretic peptide [Erpetoichthys calabaricus]|uniref:Natriuretic peptide C n=1 Tax=Erpetoichthys calabaricus TaxID=27687 RepID=A0A8C4X756_ERPCA|nr:C-type natriuretic peptide [Erpetoichthys calabaricus]
MNISHLVACGLLVALLTVTMEAKPLTPSQQKSLRNLLGEELSAYLTSDEQESGSENLRSRARLMRDLRLDTRAKAAWARLLNDHPNPRKSKGINKKGLSKGCFGLKLDRIGSMSGLGC